MIQRLNHNVINFIKSFSDISDFNECMHQLIYNSLDAKSSTIKIKYDLKCFSIAIADDGSGISLNDLNILGEKTFIPSINYANSLETYGYHGEALCNIINLSKCVQIFSTTNHQNGTNRYYLKEFKNEENIKNKNRIIELELNENFKTLVKVYNLFYKHPTRQDQELNGCLKNKNLLIDKLRALSLINFNVSFCVEDLNENSIVFMSERMASVKEKFMNLMDIKNSDLIGDVCLNDEDMTGYEINGFVYLYSKQTLQQKLSFDLNNSIFKLQFIYLNRFHVSNPEYYKIITSELCSCKEFNILNYDPNQIVFCLSIKCPPSDFRLAKLNQEQHADFIDANTNKFLCGLLKKFARKFLNDLGYKKSNDKQKSMVCEMMNNYIDNLQMDTEIYANEFKNSRASKMFKAKVDPKPEKANKAFGLMIKNIKINKTSKRNKKIILALHREPALNENKKILPQSNTSKNINFYANIENAMKRKELKRSKRNKSTQTKFPIDKIELKNDWVKQINREGVEFYINLRDGSSTYDVNLVKLEKLKTESKKHENNMVNLIEPVFNTFNVTNTNSFKKIKQIVANNLTLKWKNRCEFYKTKFLVDKKFNIQNMESLEPNKLYSNELDYDGESISKFKFDSSIFSNLIVLGQLDSKFIVAYSTIDGRNTSCYSIFLFDQHASHERVRLENIIRENVNDSGHILPQKIESPIYLKISSISEALLTNLKSNIEKFGFELEIENCEHNQSLNLKNYTIQIVKLPRILSKKLKNKNDDILSVLNKLFEGEFKSLMRENYDNRSKLFNNLSNFPTALVDAFNMESCRSAIKFGDKLGLESCNKVICELSKCKLPFQCAHGRPTLVPMQNIFIRKEGKSKLNFKNMKLDDVD